MTAQNRLPLCRGRGTMIAALVLVGMAAFAGEDRGAG
jgi:hypothetical protein